MRHKDSAMIVDQSCVEVLVTYFWERVEGGIETDLISVEVIIAGKGIDILWQLNDQQRNHIIEQVNDSL